ASRGTEYIGIHQSFQVDQFLEFGFRKDRHTQFLRFLIFRSGIGPYHYVIRLCADGARNFSPVLLHELASFLPRTIRKTSRKDKTLAGKFLALYHAFFRRWMHARLAQLLDELPVRRLREKLYDARRDLWPHLGHFLKPFFFRLW